MSRRIAPALLAVAALAVAVLVLRGGGEPYRIQAVYADAAGLKKNYEVKIDGVPAGRISSVRLDARDRAVLTLELRDGAAPIGRDATAAARPVNLLGERYVDLRPGNVRDPLPDGGVIPERRTSNPVELDDVLNVLDAGTRARLRILVNEAGTTLGAGSTDLNALLDELPSSLQDAQAMLAEVTAENGRLQAALRDGDRVLGRVASRRDDLGRLVDEASATLAVTARRRAELGATVDRAPAGLAALRSTLTQLDATADALRPAARALRASAPPLTATLAALPRFARQSGPTLRTARRVAPALTRLGRDATPELERVRPVLGQLTTFARELAPITDHLDGGGITTDLLRFMHNWVKVIDDSDGLGHIFRIHIQVGRDQLERTVARYLDLDALTGATRPRRAGAARRAARSAATAGRRPASPPAAAATPATPAPGASSGAAARPQAGDLLSHVLGTVGGLAAPGGASGRGRGDLPALLDRLLR